MIQKNNRRIINAWAMFDWANSAYSLVISTAIFPIYFIVNTPDIINIGGKDIENSSLYSFSVAFAYILIAVLSPLLSGIADSSGKRKFFLKMFTTIGSLSCIALFLFTGEATIWIGLGAFIIATIGFSGSLVFYDAYLPEIASEERMDKVSAKGYALGYIGSVLLLLFILWMINQPESFNITDPKLPARLGFLLVGCWWLGFAQITFFNLPKDRAATFKNQVLWKGFQEIKKVFLEVRTSRMLILFLISFFFMSAGVQTVIYLASTFAEKELNFETSELILIILLLQIVAIGGAFLFAAISKALGNKISLMMAIFIWASICFSAYFVQEKLDFYILAAMVGLVLGGAQSLARSSYGKMIREKKGELTSYYSFYDVVYKTSIVMGTIVFGVVNQLTGGMRASILALAIFFIIALFLLLPVQFKPIGSPAPDSSE
jgi:MFS transporter, UMF1 family